MNAVTYPEPAAEPTAPTHVTSLPQPARSRAGLAAAFAVVAVLVAAVAAYVLWPRPVPPQAEVLVTGTAEQVVAAFLHGDTATLERLVAIEIPDTLTAGQSYVRSAAAVSVLERDQGWDVIVAADHLAAVPGGFGNARIEHFLVVFEDRPTGAVVMNLPAMVPAPDAPTVTAAAWPSPPADDITESVWSYLEWLLTGTAGVFPGRAMTPPPFTDIDLVGMQRTEQLDTISVLVAIEGTRPDGSRLPLHYALRAEPVDGGWLVSLPGS